MSCRAEGSGSRSYTICGHNVEFPFKAYPSQMAFMSKVLKSLSRGENALLESPTGTGKSLALLCSALAWQSAVRREIQEAHRISGERGDLKKKEKPPPTPPIYFATRTHSQITQLVRELESTQYRPTMTILASRKHYCTHRSASRAANPREACEALLATSECAQFHRAPHLRSAVSRKGMDVWDIEDLVAEGKRVRGCPYFASRSIKDDGCELILCPYTFLVDPLVRKAVGLDVRGAVLIFDEAHNIEDIARGAGSGDFDIEALDEALSGLDEILAASIEPHVHTPIRRAAAAVLGWMRESELFLQHAGFEQERAVFSGREVAVILEQVGGRGGDGSEEGDDGTAIRKDALPKLISLIDRAAELSKSGGAQSGGEGHGLLSSRASSALTGVFTLLDLVLSNPGDFHVALEKRCERPNGQAGRRHRRGQRGGARTWVYMLRFWCMNPAVTFRLVAEPAHSVVLTSGTLSPLPSFASELATAFPHRLEAPHVIKPEQLCVGVVAAGPRGRRLLGTYKNATSFAYQDAVGEVVAACCERIPEGVLVFFPSYRMLDDMSARWRNTGAWARLESLKRVCAEPRGMDAFEKALKAYREASSRRGALMLGVCRGKLSEGIDFTDSDARAVILVGIPFPNCRDQQVLLKRKWNDGNRARGALPGAAWYELQAYRALNQAIGRCIRHRGDYGAVILVDSRFQEPRVTKNLSRWFRSRLPSRAPLPETLRRLETFFEAKRPLARAAREKQHAADAKVAASKGKRGSSRRTKANKGGSVAICAAGRKRNRNVLTMWRDAAAKMQDAAPTRGHKGKENARNGVGKPATSSSSKIVDPSNQPKQAATNQLNPLEQREASGPEIKKLPTGTPAKNKSESIPLGQRKGLAESKNCRSSRETPGSTLTKQSPHARPLDAETQSSGKKKPRRRARGKIQAQPKPVKAVCTDGSSGWGSSDDDFDMDCAFFSRRRR